MKIVCLGDSLTWGKYGGSYFDALVKLTPEHTLINAGVGGNTVVNLLRRLESDVFVHNPDAVFIMVGGNDAISYHSPKTRTYYIKVHALDAGHVTPTQFEQAYRDLLSELQIRHILPLIALEPTEYSTHNVAVMRDYNQIAAAVAHTFNVPTLDLLTLLAPPSLQDRPLIGIEFILSIGARERSGWTDYETVRARDGYTYTFDGIHFTHEGAERAAQLIAAFMRANFPAS